MKTQAYIQQMTAFYDHIISFIETENEYLEEYNKLTTLIETIKITSSKEEFRTILRIISKISSNHYRSPDFFKRIELLLTYLSENIKKVFNNEEIFNMFCINKRIILILLKNNIMTINDCVSTIITENLHFYSKLFRPYFLPELRNIISEDQIKKIEKGFLLIDPTIFNDFENKRLLGENETYLCQIIRSDSIDDFIVYFNQKNLSISTTIKPSIFETNYILLKKDPTLIEYAAFFGSIRIFQYLKLNGAQLDQSILKYAIHSNNAEIINILEENMSDWSDDLYELCLKESIKCHHNNLAEYFLMNFTNKNKSQIIQNSKINNHVAP